MSDLTKFTTVSSTQRFLGVGVYSQEQLLRDLRDLNAEVQALRKGVGSGELEGDKGDSGPPGSKGDQGSPGSPGSSGSDGLNAYQLAVLYDGFTGSLSDYLNSLQGPAGTNGLNSLIYSTDFGLLNRDYGAVSGLPIYVRDAGTITGIDDGKTAVLPALINFLILESGEVIQTEDGLGYLERE